MDLNGNGITTSNDVWEMMKPNNPKLDDGRTQHPNSAKALVPVLRRYRPEIRPGRARLQTLHVQKKQTLCGKAGRHGTNLQDA